MVIIVFIVVIFVVFFILSVLIVIDEFPRRETVGGFVAGGAVGVVECQFSTTEESLCRRMPVTSVSLW